MLAGHSIVRETHQAGFGTGPKYHECPGQLAAMTLLWFTLFITLYFSFP